MRFLILLAAFLLPREILGGGTLYVIVEDTRPQYTRYHYSEEQFKSDLVRDALETPIRKLVRRYPQHEDYLWELHWARHNISEQIRVEVVTREDSEIFIPTDCKLPAWTLSTYGKPPQSLIPECYWTPIMICERIEYLGQLCNVAIQPWDTYRYFSEYCQNDRWMLWVFVGEFTRHEIYKGYPAEVTYRVSEYVPRLQPSPPIDLPIPVKTTIRGVYKDDKGNICYFSDGATTEGEDRRVLLYLLDQDNQLILSDAERAFVEDLLHQRKLEAEHPPVDCPLPDGLAPPPPPAEPN